MLKKLIGNSSLQNCRDSIQSFIVTLHSHSNAHFASWNKHIHQYWPKIIVGHWLVTPFTIIIKLLYLYYAISVHSDLLLPQMLGLLDVALIAFFTPLCAVRQFSMTFIWHIFFDTPLLYGQEFSCMRYILVSNLVIYSTFLILIWVSRKQGMMCAGGRNIGFKHDLVG